MDVLLFPYTFFPTVTDKLRIILLTYDFIMMLYEANLMAHHPGQRVHHFASFKTGDGF